jgi:hypothetical protein
MIRSNNLSLSLISALSIITKLAITLILSFLSFVSIAENTNMAINNSIDALITNNKLTVTTKMQLAEPQIIGQPLILSIEVATDRWFAKGTHIKRFSIADVTILSGSELSINSTKRIKGQTWASQTREITLYPSKAKNYLLPTITIEISINTELNGIVSGLFTTEPQQFTITKPKALANIERFVVSPDFTLEVITNDGTNNEDSANNGINDDKDNEQAKHEYAIGDAITQTITLTAKDTPAMMLPEIKPVSLSGVSLYQQPSKVFDKSNRGQLIGRRIESFTYIFEQKGSYNIPEQIIYWWNTQTNELEQVIIPASTWQVDKGKKVIKGQWTKTLTDGNNVTQLIILFFAAMLVLLFLVILKQKHQKIVLWYKNITKFEKRQTKQLFFKEIRQKNYVVARQYLFNYQDIIVKNNKHNQEKNNLPLSSLFTALNQCAFDPSYNQKTQFTLEQAKNLIDLLDKETKDKTIKPHHISFTADIKLNK